MQSALGPPQGEFRFDYRVDAEMLAVARTLAPRLQRCGPRAGTSASGGADCVRSQPRLIVGGLGVSGGAFVANPQVRDHLFGTLHAEAMEMETAALAHVAQANGAP